MNARTELVIDRTWQERLAHGLDALKPQLACLASRFPYGKQITKDGLVQVAGAERALRELGFRQFRVRHHGEVARVELDELELERALDPKLRRQIHDRIKACGFAYVALDLIGYRTGSMNETLTRDERSIHNPG